MISVVIWVTKVSLILIYTTKGGRRATKVSLILFYTTKAGRERQLRSLSF